MHRFFVAPEEIQDDTVAFRGPPLHQIRDVLRLRVGDRFLVLDNRGYEYLVELNRMERDAATALVLEKREAPGEPRLEITLYQALLKGAKFELVLQKGTELGIRAFVPVMSERCVVEAPSEVRMARWRRHLQEAAEQCRRGRIPLLLPPLPFEEACQKAEGLSLLPWEEERGTSLRQALRAEAGKLKEGRVSLFIGPEGGLTPAEVAGARQQGILPVSLGHRILRAETAGPVVAALILYEAGELETPGLK